MCTSSCNQPEQPYLREELLRAMTYEMSKRIAEDPAKAEELGQAVLKYIDTVTLAEGSKA